MFKFDGPPMPSFLPAVRPHLHHLARSDRPGNSLSWGVGWAIGGYCLDKGLLGCWSGQRMEVKGPHPEALEVYVKSYAT